MYKLKIGVEIEDIGDEIIVIDSSNGRFLEINPIGHIILMKLLEGISVKNISDELSMTYNKDLKESTEIINNYIKKLEELEILCAYG